MGFFSYNCATCKLPILNKWVVQNYEKELNEEDLNLLKAQTKAIVFVGLGAYEGVNNGYGKLINPDTAYEFDVFEEDEIYDFREVVLPIMIHSICKIGPQHVPSTECDFQGYFIDFHELKTYIRRYQ